MRPLLVVFSRRAHILRGDRHDALASQLKLLCRYSVDSAPSRNASLLSVTDDPYLLIIKQTTVGRRTRPPVTIDPCTTAFIK